MLAFLAVAKAIWSQKLKWNIMAGWFLLSWNDQSLGQFIWNQIWIPVVLDLLLGYWTILQAPEDGTGSRTREKGVESGWHPSLPLWVVPQLCSVRRIGKVRCTSLSKAVCLWSRSGTSLSQEVCVCWENSSSPCSLPARKVRQDVDEVM